jgi:MFS transporter, ACS family, tartrate transporter
MPTMISTGAAAACGIAFINAFGTIGGALGPALVGWLKGATGSYAGGLYGLAAFTGVGALIASGGLHIPRRVGATAVAPAE